MIFRFLNMQGVAGIAVGLALAALLITQKFETRHWKKQSAGFEQLYLREQASVAATIANYRASADQARAADKANAARVAAEQKSINQRTRHDFESRLAAARADFDRLRIQFHAPADPGPGRGSPLSGMAAPAGGAAQTTSEDRLSRSDRLTATEQAIQLDELIKWVRRQAEVDNSPKAVASPPGD